MQAKDLISQVRRIEIRSRKIVDELCGGAYHSRFKGRGIEFDEVREYTYGDDVRDIDWNVTARMNAPFIKKYVEERELHVLLAVDVSASTLFGSTDKTKIRIAAELCALIAMSAIRNHDKVGLVKFTDTIEKQIPIRSGRSHVLRLICDLVANAPVDKKSDFELVLTHLRQSLKKHTVIFLISDFLTENKAYESSLRMLSKKHDLILIQLKDQCEQQFPSSGFWNLSDSETDISCSIFASKKFTKAYAEKAQARSDELHTIAAKAKAGLIEIDTTSDIVKPLMHYFKSKKR